MPTCAHVHACVRAFVHAEICACRRAFVGVKSHYGYKSLVVNFVQFLNTEVPLLNHKRREKGIRQFLDNSSWKLMKNDCLIISIYSVKA